MKEFAPSNHGMLLPAEDDRTPVGGGGLCLIATASGALNVGDAVQLSAVDTVTKTIVTADHDQRIGIVVGGTQTGMRALVGSDALGIAAAADGEQVLVQYSGVAWAVADANTVAAGDKVKLGETTAGRVLDGTDTTDLAAGITGQILGTALDTAAAAGDPVRVLLTLG